ncbi:hypothetical protein HQ45_09650 [Porphyromonas crevioricanis]|nr:NAD(P)-dependent oxidoreductase [Porphyromonas crevioricanis]KGN88918.1 hypothetical protein HQ45_09650 [Porphyromonas crevioricanis]KGN95809.1 hypothetical protein HQ38_02220 [Porphyromonas crevioricanis]SJZ74737.1 Nucleoside-diphosphate-sugar epimerase [Porphyromonas crevioricanis]
MNNTSKIRVLLVGATNPLGKEILSGLMSQKEQFEISVFDRKTSANMTFLEKHKGTITVYYGDILDEEALREACAGQDFVIHNNSLPREQASKSLKQAEAINVLGTHNLVETLEQYSPTALLLYISTMGVYGDRLKSPMISAQDIPGPVLGDYDAITKMQAEKIVREASLDWIIYRPGYILYTQGIKLSPEIFKTPLSTRMELIHAQDLSTAVIKSYEQRNRLWGHIYNVGGGEACRITYEQLIKRFLSELHIDFKDIPDHSFATRNGSGGYFADSNSLNDQIGFRTYSIDRYFEELGKSKGLLKRVSSALFGSVRGKSLFAQSEPLKAHKSGDPIRSKYFF